METGKVYVKKLTWEEEYPILIFLSNMQEYDWQDHYRSKDHVCSYTCRYFIPGEDDYDEATITMS